MIRKPQTSNVPFDEEQVMNAIFPEKHTNGLVDSFDMQMIDLKLQTHYGLSEKEAKRLNILRACDFEQLDLDKEAINDSNKKEDT